MKIAFYIIIILVLAVVVGDFIYSKVVTARWAKWEATVVRDEQGVRAKCAPFAMGEGRTALLMVHGFADSPALYRKYAPAFAEKGYHCQAIRLPGWAVHMDEMKTVDLGDWENKIIEEVVALRKRHDQVWIVSHSLGAALTLNLSIDEKIPVDGVVLITPMVKVADTRSPVLSSAQWFEVSKRILNFSTKLESIFKVDMRDQSMADQLYRDTFVPRNIYQALFDLMAELKGRAGEMNVPTLMILAKEDLIIDTPAAERFFKRIASEYRKLVMVEDSGHVIPLDNDWEATVDLIDNFIQGREGVEHGSH